MLLNLCIFFLYDESELFEVLLHLFHHFFYLDLFSLCFSLSFTLLLPICIDFPLLLLEIDQLLFGLFFFEGENFHLLLVSGKALLFLLSLLFEEFNRFVQSSFCLFI
jgi:hypothetical protein